MHRHRSNYSCKCLFSFHFHFFIISVIIFTFHESEHLINISIVDSSYDSFYRLQSTCAWGKYYSMGWSAATIYQCIAIQAFCVVSIRDEKLESSGSSAGPVQRQTSQTSCSVFHCTDETWGLSWTSTRRRLISAILASDRHSEAALQLTVLNWTSGCWNSWDGSSTMNFGESETRQLKTRWEFQPKVLVSVRWPACTALSVKLMLRGFLRFLLVKLLFFFLSIWLH